MPLAKKHAKSYTYADYLKWDDSIRVELINGKVYDMTPAPSRIHQEVSMKLSVVFGSFLEGKKCRVFAAPFDVRLTDKSSADQDITTVVQPDISIICDPKKLDQRGCLGAPDMVVEIVSPETVIKDMREKLDLYERHGVKEYWIVHPVDKTVMVFNLHKSGAYGKPSTYSPPDEVKVTTLKGLSVKLVHLFSG